MRVRSFVNGALGRFGYSIKRDALHAFPIEASPEELATIRRAKSISMTSVERLWSVIQSTKYVSENNLEGVFVECGVWRGGSSYAAMRTLTNMGDTSREFWLYDTYQGMTEPTDFDIDGASGMTARAMMNMTNVGDGNNIWALSPLSEVEANLATSGYPMNKVKFIVGDVQRTSIEQKPKSISILRLDTDWYESTKAELHNLYPLLESGGVCIIDDYGHWSGARKAVDEYLRDHKAKPLINRIDYSGRLWIKS